MCKRSNLQSAICIGNGDNDVVVLVVGGCGGKSNEAELLSNRPYKMGVKQINRVNPWRWHKLSPMHEERPCRPGLLLLGRERVLVCGGGDSIGRNRTAEILQLPRDDNDKGVWTLITQPMTHGFCTAFLVNFNNRIVAVGVLFINLVTMSSKNLCLT